MAGAPVDLRTTTHGLIISIKKEGGLSSFQAFSAGLLGFGHVFLIMWIWKSISSDGLPVMKVIFTVFGCFGLINLNKQLRVLVLYSVGVDTIELRGRELRITSRLGILSRRVAIKMDSIKKLGLVGKSNLPAGMSIFSPNAMKEGAILVEWGSRKELHIGQFLEREELITVYEAMKRCVLVDGRSATT